MVVPMNNPISSLPVNLQVNEPDKTFRISVPWNEICESNREAVWEWLAEVKRIRAEWEARGYRFT
jgi:hypothetical protein